MQPHASLAKVRPLLDRMTVTLLPVLRESVTPICVLRGERTIPWGTGTLFRVADESFLITASHVWDEAVAHGFEHNLFAFNLDGRQFEEGAGMRPVALRGKVYRVKDPPDVAAIELDADIVSELSGCRFLRLSDVALKPRESGRCWVFGFPLETAKDIPARSLFLFNQFFVLAPFHKGAVSLDNYDPALHFLLDVARDDLWLSDGSPGEMPYRLNGISGCSVWQPEWPKNNSPDSWDPGKTRIVGVQTSYYREPSLIKATPWGAVAALLHKTRPDLRGAIELSLGPPR